MIIKPGYAGITFELPDDTIIADIGFGHDPVRGATYYIDKDLGESYDRDGRSAAWVPTERFIRFDVSKGIPLPRKSCDFVVASHIAEHMDDPKKFCKELSWVGKAGYVETPGVVQELCLHTAGHKWYVWKFNGTLIFIRKPKIIRNANWKIPMWFPVRVLLYLCRQTCYHWKDEIKVMVL